MRPLNSITKIARPTQVFTSVTCSLLAAPPRTGSCLAIGDPSALWNAGREECDKLSSFKVRAYQDEAISLHH
jgi:hypothetical protein